MALRYKKILFRSLCSFLCGVIFLYLGLYLLLRFQLVPNVKFTTMEEKSSPFYRLTVPELDIHDRVLISLNSIYWPVRTIDLLVFKRGVQFLPPKTLTYMRKFPPGRRSYRFIEP